MDVYDIIDSLLKSHNITRQQLCEKTGINYGSLNASINRKSSKLPYNVLIAIAKYFHVTVDYLLGNDKSVSNMLSNPKDIEHFNEFRQLNDQGKAKATAYVRDIKSTYPRYPKKPLRNDELGDIRMLPLYDYPASAGQGIYCGTGDYELVAVPEDAPASTSFGVTISGDSMEPDIPDGSIVWVRQQPDVDTDEICLVVINDEGYCKIKGERGFESINPKYKTIRPGIDDIVSISGLVVYIQPPEEQ